MVFNLNLEWPVNPEEENVNKNLTVGNKLTEFELIQTSLLKHCTNRELQDNWARKINNYNFKNKSI